MLINQEIRSTKVKGSERFLIVAFSFDGESLALSDLNCPSPKKPMSLAFSEVIQKLEAREWEVVDHDLPEFLFLPEDELKKEWRDIRDEARSYVSELVDDDRMVNEYLFGDASGIFERLVKVSGKSRSYVHGKLARWFRYGSMDNALLPHYANCGSNPTMPDKPKFLEDGSVCLASKPGKKTKYGDPYRLVTKWDLKLIEKFSKKIPSGRKVVLEDLFKRFIAEYAKVSFTPKFKIKQEEVEPTDIKIPRRYLIPPRSFKRFLNKFIPHLDWINKRKGKTAYEKDHKGKSGIARKGLRNAGQRYEIDATVADVYIKYPYSITELLSCGRPVVYFVIDTYSSMIVGVHICFDGPNWHGASQALFNAFEDKVEFCRRWGVEITEDQWPCSFVCQEIVWDRGGENTDKNLGSVLRGKIGVMIMKLVAYHRGDCKGTVEKMFDVVVNKVVSFIPGKVEKAPVKEDQHSSRRPFLEYEEFMARIIKLILHKNNFSTKTESHNFHMETLQIGYTPRDIWNHFMGQMITKPKVGVDKRRFALMPEAKAVVRDKGVYFNGLYFSSREIEKRQWLDKAKNIGWYSISIRYTDVTTNHIWYYDDESKSFLKLDLQDRCEAYKNQIWASVLHRLEIRKQELALLDAQRFSDAILLEMDLTEMDKVTEKRNRKLIKSEAKGVEKGIDDRKSDVIAVHRNYDADRITHDMSSSETPENYAVETSADDSFVQDLSDPTVIND